MLSEKIRSTDFNWDDAKSKLKKDSRWTQVADLDRTEMENTFNHHMAKVFESFRRNFVIHESFSDVKTLRTPWLAIFDFQIYGS